ncbi:MAG: TetR/AcrR family transcriptional regulator [Myxococcota bacterium]|nr:TetR/AcrR family transcriptional regulator [Myxococcota bacterium]
MSALTKARARRPVGRPRQTERRRREIVDAYLGCVARKGLAASTMSATARAMRLDRSTLHHYFRTREELTRAAVERVIARYREPADAALAAAPEGERLEALLDHLFGPGFDDAELSRVLLEFSMAARTDPEALRELKRIYETLEGTALAELERRFPDADPATRRRVALAIVQLGEGAATFRELGFGRDRDRAARAAADDLLAQLAH